jgi:predicted Zn-dependent peptidase
MVAPIILPHAPDHTHHTLDNGIQCVAVRAPGLRSAMLAIYVRVGSRYESVRTNGISHFLEHVFFRGSRQYPSTFALNVAVEDFGGNLNGSTGRESSAYFTPLHPAHLEVGIRVLADMLSAPLLEGVELEREIILEEMLDEVDETGRDIDLDNLAKMQLFSGHGLALKIAGTPESVRGIRAEELGTHLAQHYHGGNLVVCAAGDFEPRALFDACERHLGHFAKAKTASPLVPPRVPEAITLTFVDHPESQAEFRLSFSAPTERHPDYYPMLMISRLLDDGLSSRLQRAVVEERALAYSVGAGVDRFSDISLFELEAASTPAKAPAVVEEMLKALAKLAQQAPPEEELQRARVRHAIALEFSLDSTTELCGWYGSGALFGDPDDFISRRRRLEAVTPAEVQRVAQTLFRAGRAHLTYVGPLKTRERDRLEKLLEAPPGLT